MEHPLPSSYVNKILAFLQNIDDDNDAQQFVRLTVNAQQLGAERKGLSYSRQYILDLICEAKGHRWQDRSDMIDDVKDERYMMCRICGEVTRHDGNV